MISHFINEPDHWRARAEEARMLANQMNDSESGDAMLRIAEDYERHAKRAEDRIVAQREPRERRRVVAPRPNGGSVPRPKIVTCQRTLQPPKQPAHEGRN
jgi:hypothetical protein